MIEQKHISKCFNSVSTSNSQTREMETLSNIISTKALKKLKLEWCIEGLASIKEAMKKGQEDIQKDKGLAQDHKENMLRQENNQIPTQKQIAATDYIESVYEGFLEDGAENTPVQKADELIFYLKQEQVSNEKEQYKNQCLQNTLVNGLRKLGYLPVPKREGFTSIGEHLNISISIPQSSVSSAEKKPFISSPSDYIDSLPKDYSPFDDLGED